MINIETMIDMLVDQVDDMDLQTIIELAKEHQRTFYESKTDKEIESYYNETFGEE